MADCNACNSPLKNGAKFCDVCQSWQGKPCVACGRGLPAGAKRCDECDTYQRGLRRFFSASQTTLALLTALISVTSPLILAVRACLNDPSHTSLMVTGVEDRKLRTYAWNTGNKPGRLMSAEVDFGRYPYEDQQLEPDNLITTLIPPGGSAESPVKGVLVEFRIPILKVLAKSAKDQTRSPALLVVVHESNDKSRTLSVPLEPSVIDTLIEEGRPSGR